MFQEFPKIARLNRRCIITEKIDGTNAQIEITDDGEILTGSRTRYITPEQDNMKFAAWVKEHAEELKLLGPGRHFGEWWGRKIQRGYELQEKRFSLFNTLRWGVYRDLEKFPEDHLPACCSTVPVMFDGLFHSTQIEYALERLRVNGSLAAPGYMNPEGIVIYHVAANMSFKITLEKDSEWKGKNG